MLSYNFYKIHKLLRSVLTEGSLSNDDEDAEDAEDDEDDEDDAK